MSYAGIAVIRGFWPATFVLFVGAACAQETPLLTVGLRESAKHRPAPAPVHSGRQVEPGHAETYMWLKIDPQGRVIDVHDITGKDLDPAVQSAARKMHYVPFTRDGIPVPARVQDMLTVLPGELKPRRVVSFPEISNTADVSITLSRSGCYGTCPSYTIVIRGDGNVRYRGNRFVSITGSHTSHVDAAKVSGLLDRFRAANFFGLEDSYRASVTDNPTYQLSIKIGQRSKIVEDYVGEWVGMPDAVKELEDTVDMTADSARWVTSSSSSVEAMQQAGIEFTSPQATQVLWAAVDVGDLVTVGQLLAAGTSIGLMNSSSGWSRFPSASVLELAVESRNEGTRLKTVEALLSLKAVRTDKSAIQRALARAVESGDVDLAKALISAGANPSGRFTGRYQQEGWTYLMLSAASGAWAMLDDALARPHDIHAVDSEGHTALVVMVRNAPQMEDIFPLVDRLLGAGARRSELDRVLLEDCNRNWIPGLIARGGNINARDAKGNTPLFQSCTVEGVQALLEAGADPRLRNNEGKTAIDATYPPEGGKEDSRAAVIRRFSKSHVR